MARINDRLVVQLVADNIVFMDPVTGREDLLPVQDAPRLAEMVTYLHGCWQDDRNGVEKPVRVHNVSSVQDVKDLLYRMAGGAG